MLIPVDTNHEPARRSRSLELPTVEPDPNRIAVLLNRNARKVTDKLAKRIERIIGSDHVFYSHSLDEAEAFAREIVQRGYGTILSGGGDGTLCRTFNLVQRYIDESNAWRTERALRYGERQSLIGAPRFGFLRLGTGNGISQVVGAGNPLRDLQTVVDYSPGRTHEVPLIESEGERFFFGGVGYDSMVLNDYNTLKHRTENPLLKRMMHGLTGYFVTILSRSIPRVLLGKMNLEARVVTNGPAYYVDPRRGDAAIPIEPGSTLFEGPARVIGAGTSPYFGYGFRAFPFSNIHPGKMHLRISTIGPLKMLSVLPSIWNGTYRNPRQVQDFLVEDISIELANPFPFQHSGDAQGMRRRIDMRISDTPLRLVDFHRPRLLNA